MRKITICGLVIVAVLAVGWDIAAFFLDENATISVVITDWSRSQPAVGFLFGLIAGHWFFPARGSED